MKVRLVVTLSLLISALAVAAVAQEPSAIAPRAVEILKQARTTLASAQTLALSADVTVDEVAGTGQKLQSGGVVTIRLQRPNRVLAEHNGDRFHRVISYDGKSVTVLDVDKGLYASFDAPDTIDGMLTFARENFGVTFPLGEMISAKPAEQILSKVESGLYLGLHKVAGTPCHHLAFTTASVDWQIWVEDGAQALIRKLVVTYKTMPQSPQFTAVIRNWELGKPLAEGALKLVIPKDASKIEIERKGAEVKP